MEVTAGDCCAGARPLLAAPQRNPTSLTTLVLLMMIALPGLFGCGGSDSQLGTQPAPAPTTPPVTYAGNQITLALSGLAATAATGPSAAIRSSVNYYRHWNHSYQDYIAHSHETTRAIDLNFALSISTSAADFRSRLTNAGVRHSVMYQEALRASDNLIVFFDTMPAWLSSCSAKLGSAAACRTAASCGYKGGVTYDNLYPPGDWTAWTSIVNTTVDVLLDLTEWNGHARNVYLEAWNEPNVRECSWNDTHENFLDFYHRTSVAFTQARDALCASKGLTAQRCQRLKFGGPAVGAWNARIDNNRTATLIEDLLADSLTRAAANSDHRLDFVSYHGFWNPVPGPRNQIALARAHIHDAYAAVAGVTPAFPLPEIVVSEWNGGDATRAGTYHPTVMAEAYFGLLENDVGKAAIASLDAYSNSATLASNDFGLLLTDAVQIDFKRPAYYVYSAFRTLSEAGSTPPFYHAHDTFRVVATGSGIPNCYNVVLWDFAPDALTSALNDLISRLPTTINTISQSYATASYPGTAPSACDAYVSASNKPVAMKALCSDLYNGNCASIPTPTPAEGHECDAAWTQAFDLAGAIFRKLSSNQASMANIQISDFSGPADLAQVVGEVIDEDHAHPAPKPLSLGLGTDAKSLSFSIHRNSVVTLSNVCARNY